MPLTPTNNPHAERDLERSVNNLVDTLVRYVETRVTLAFALEGDRTDARLRELRDELLSKMGEPALEWPADQLKPIRRELAAMAERQTRLTQTVADLMVVVDPAGRHSIRVPDGR